ncbi:MAG: alpha/beta hydrolase [Eubacteriales bacterium]|nr:alpha/beta hydrolase [Eubacteriales bacterium]
MKKVLVVLFTVLLVLGCLPASSLAIRKPMGDDVPVWTEETVKQYALDFIHGNDMDRLYGYYDLQIRRYMPMDTFTGMLTEIEWMTGDFVAFGTYRVFEETDLLTKTHVLHLCMEKQDLDLYFTHKTKADDWEIMAVEFVPAEKQTVDASQVTSADTDTQDTALSDYTEISVQVGQEPYLLEGILTLPNGASAENKAPGVVLVQGSGPSDMDESIGQTKLFADIARIFAMKGVATLRYDKRTYTYGSVMTAEEIANLTVEEETIQDAISAGQLLAANECIDPAHVVVLGHSMGAMLAPRIASEAHKVFTAMILVAGSPKCLLDIMITQNEDVLAKLEGDTLAIAQAQVDAFKEQVKALKRVKKAEDAKAMTIAGINGYYFWEMMQVDPVALIKKLKLPTYIVQGNQDFQISMDNGIDAYEDEIEIKYSSVEYKLFRNLNHLLMIYEGPAENKGTVAEYDTPATLDKQAGRDLADWVLRLSKTGNEE